LVTTEKGEKEIGKEMADPALLLDFLVGMISIFG
jgi:hypothetical protein